MYDLNLVPSIFGVCVGVGEVGSDRWRVQLLVNICFS